MRACVCDYDLCNECTEKTLREQAVVNMNAKDGAGSDKDCIDRVDGSGVGVDASSGGSGQKKKKKKKNTEEEKNMEGGKKNKKKKGKKKKEEEKRKRKRNKG